ncbi:MAG: helicase-related protein, partial [Myxococcota bacterium]
MAKGLPALPIDGHLEQALGVLRRGNLVLVAEPGAGKTTRLPRAMLGAFGEGEILVLEPRRIAARLAARRVADELGERVGERVGYTVRFDDRRGPATRLRFVTEGILVRRLARDPELAGVAAVVLDELHERHLAGDLALAVLRRLQARRPELRLVAMSATLEAEPVATFLDAEVLRVPGRTHPVSLEHLGSPTGRLEEAVAKAVRRALDDEADGDVLVFLPGAGAIRRAERACAGLARKRGAELAVLHGDLPPESQDRALRRGDARKVILSTNIAESSVTLPAVTTVVDAGLVRRASVSPLTGLPVLATVPISQASATQRAGRAGRVRPGRAYRLFSAAEL